MTDVNKVKWQLWSKDFSENLDGIESPVICGVISNLPKTVNTWENGNWHQKPVQVFFYDPEISDDQTEEYKRVLDDSPEKDWVEFFKYAPAYSMETTPEGKGCPQEYHRGFSKEQKNGGTLILLRESYPGATEMPPIYFLIQE